MIEASRRNQDIDSAEMLYCVGDDAPHVDTKTGYLDLTNRYYVSAATTASSRAASRTLSYETRIAGRAPALISS